jgi:hypothetical protein
MSYFINKVTKIELSDKWNIVDDAAERHTHVKSIVFLERLFSSDYILINFS